MKKIRKAIIPTAGLGTRFLPASKTVPKELFPLVDKPLILYILEECLDAGIEDVILITGRGKSAIEDFFDRSYELEDTLEKSGKIELLKSIQRVRNMANIISVRQKEALGLGHAVLTGSHVVGNEPFAVLLGDEIMIGKPSPTKELTQIYSDTGVSAVAIMEVAASEVSKYGIVAVSPDASQRKDGLFQITNVVEKPSVQDAPSRLALPGRYVFDPKLFSYLRDTKPGKNGEIQLTDGMVSLASRDSLFGSKFKAKRFDAGDKLGFLQANIEIGLDHPEIGSQLGTYLKSLIQELK